jgi:predicted nucleic acid-binding OB-fold protein
MENLNDYLQRMIESIDLTENERKEMQEYVADIIKQSEPVYKFLKEIESDKEKRDIVITKIREIIGMGDV